MALTPLHDRVLVERVEGDEKTSGGLIIPESAKEKPAEGMIVAVGEGARTGADERPYPGRDARFGPDYRQAPSPRLGPAA